jgi:hypothetical protein
MPEDTARQTIIDEEHLKLLSLGFMVSAGVSAFFAGFGLFYVLMGIIRAAIFSHMPPSGGHPVQAAPPAVIGWFSGLFGFAMFVAMMTVALLKFRAASCIKLRKSRTLCMVISGISCLEIPYGTLLGVLAFIVLGRGSVAALFQNDHTRS